MINLKDQELVDLFKTGDVEAFAELVNRYQEKARNLALRITRHEEDAEEVLQDVFMTVYTKIDGFEGKSAFASWLYRITANTAFMLLRKRKKHAQNMSLEQSNFHANEDQDLVEQKVVQFPLTNYELKANLQAAIDALPEEYRLIFILRDVDGLSNAEVSEIVALSIPAVKSRLHRAREMLRCKLAKYYQDCQDVNYISYGSRALAANA